MKRALRNLIRLVAAGLIVFGALEIGLEFIRHRMQKADVSVWRCMAGGILAAAGGLLFAAGAKLAGRLTDEDE